MFQRFGIYHTDPAQHIMTPNTWSTIDHLNHLDHEYVQWVKLSSPHLSTRWHRQGEALPACLWCLGISNKSSATFISSAETLSVIFLNGDLRLPDFAHLIEQEWLPYHFPSWLHVTISVLTAHSNIKLVPLFGSPLIWDDKQQRKTGGRWSRRLV